MLRQLLSFLIFFGAASSADALVLGELNPGPNGGGSSNLGDGLTVYLAFSDEFHTPGSNPNAELFESVFFTPSDVGKTFVADASNEVDFADAVAVLVNGTDDFLSVAVQITDSQDPGSRSGGNDRTRDESIWFPTTPCGSGPDFAGCRVSSVELRMDSMMLRKFDPPRGGIRTEYSAAITVFVNGHIVPEPSTALLLAVGLGAMAVGQRRRVHCMSSEVLGQSSRSA